MTDREAIVQLEMRTSGDCDHLICKAYDEACKLAISALRDRISRPDCSDCWIRHVWCKGCEGKPKEQGDGYIK